jgi:hypothetical protein
MSAAATFRSPWRLKGLGYIGGIDAAAFRLQ